MSIGVPILTVLILSVILIFSLSDVFGLYKKVLVCSLVYIFLCFFCSFGSERGAHSLFKVGQSALRQCYSQPRCPTMMRKDFRIMNNNNLAPIPGRIIRMFGIIFSSLFQSTNQTSAKFYNKNIKQV